MFNKPSSGISNASSHSRCLVILLYLGTVTSVLSTDSPVIGIVAQEYTDNTNMIKAFPNHTSYIAASYVKNIEAAGARVVPILIGKDREYYAQILSQINGVVFPGGGVYFNNTNGYADVGRHIFPLIENMNAQGDTFPVLGVCLGFELLIQLSANDQNYLKKCLVQQVNLNLDFTKGVKKSSLFHNVPNKTIRQLATLPLTHNNHIWCVLEKDMVDHHLTDIWNVLAFSSYKGLEFVSIVEHKSYPIVGLQFHPEKNAHEWTEAQHNPHTNKAITTARIFSDWFIEKARLSKHAFPSRDLLYRSVIQNYANVMSYPSKVGFEQVYLFK